MRERGEEKGEEKGGKKKWSRVREVDGGGEARRAERESK